MTTKERVIQESISRINKRIKTIESILTATPVSEIIKIRMDAQKLLDENKSIEQRMSAEFSRKIGDLARRERNQFNIAKKASNTIALIDEKVDLEFELLELKNELYNIQRRK